MAFSTLFYLLLFLPATLLIYHIVPSRFKTAQNIILLLSSLFFVYYGGFEGFAVMLASAAANYFFGILIDKTAEKKSGRIVFVIAIAANLALLSYFKYSAFAVRNINALFGCSLAIPDILMPIGISFFTFSNLSYIIDVRRGTVRADMNILNILTYVSFFPKFVSGPIARYKAISDGLNERKITLDSFTHGLRMVIFGLGKKMLIADSLSALSTEIFSTGGTGLEMSVAWLGAIAYTFTIYFDFSGYSDMAQGAALMLGYELPINFNYPYISKSITEFWRRWHITLSGWFRDYIYIPLGGNRRGKARQIFNIFVVWCLTGLWHGASWNFVLWGLYFAVILTAEKLFLGKLLERMPAFFSHLYAVILIIIGWVIFNVGSLSGIYAYVRAMFSFTFGSAATAGQSILYYLTEYKFELIAAVIFSMPVARLVSEKYEQSGVFNLIRNVAALLVLAASLICIVNSTFTPFIYLRF